LNDKNNFVFFSGTMNWTRPELLREILAWLNMYELARIRSVSVLWAKLQIPFNVVWGSFSSLERTVSVTGLPHRIRELQQTSFRTSQDVVGAENLVSRCRGLTSATIYVTGPLYSDSLQTLSLVEIWQEYKWFFSQPSHCSILPQLRSLELYGRPECMPFVYEYLDQLEQLSIRFPGAEEASFLEAVLENHTRQLPLRTLIMRVQDRSKDPAGKGPLVLRAVPHLERLSVNFTHVPYVGCCERLQYLGTKLCQWFDEEARAQIATLKNLRHLSVPALSNRAMAGTQLQRLEVLWHGHFTDFDFSPFAVFYPSLVELYLESRVGSEVDLRPCVHLKNLHLGKLNQTLLLLPQGLEIFSGNGEWQLTHAFWAALATVQSITFRTTHWGCWTNILFDSDGLIPQPQLLQLRELHCRNVSEYLLEFLARNLVAPVLDCVKIFGNLTDKFGLIIELCKNFPVRELRLARGSSERAEVIMLLYQLERLLQTDSLGLERVYVRVHASHPEETEWIRKNFTEKPVLLQHPKLKQFSFGNRNLGRSPVRPLPVEWLVEEMFSPSFLRCDF
jgi:hypothetical protein